VLDFRSSNWFRQMLISITTCRCGMWSRH
jgi:hypothetical protein